MSIRMNLKRLAVLVLALGMAAFAQPRSSAVHPAELTAPYRLENLVASVDSPVASSRCWDYKPTERGFAIRHNAERSSKGVSKLRLDPELSRAARSHTRKMARATKLYHTADQTLRRRIVNWVILGENVGVGGSVESLHEAFMASPGHRANVLYPSFRHFGIGVKELNGRMWVTVIFQATENPRTRLNMPSC